MKLETANLADSIKFGEWAVAKVEHGYDLEVDELRGTILKVENAFYIPARNVIFLGPLVPNPHIDGKKLTVALHRMVKDIRKYTTAQIVYLNYEQNGVDEAAERIGGFHPIPNVKVKTRHGEAQVMVLDVQRT